jgi:hypothetical protein
MYLAIRKKLSCGSPITLGSGGPLCQALTEDGKLCPNEALTDSDCCKSHQPRKQKSFGRVWTFVSVGLAILGALSFVINRVLPPVADITGIYSTATHDNKKDVLDGTKYIYDVVQDINKNTQVFGDIFLKPKKINILLGEEVKAKHVSLMGEYPLGYALFYTDGQEIYAPKSASESVDVELNGAKVLAYTDKYVTLSIPRIEVRRPGRITNEFKTSFALMRGATDKLYLWGPEMHSTAMSAKILVDKKDYIVGVIGFDKGTVSH